MNRKIINLFTFAIFTIGLTTGSDEHSGAKRPYRVSDRNVQNLLNRIETRTDVYKRDLDAALDTEQIKQY